MPSNCLYVGNEKELERLEKEQEQKEKKEILEEMEGMERLEKENESKSGLRFVIFRLSVSLSVSTNFR